MVKVTDIRPRYPGRDFVRQPPASLGSQREGTLLVRETVEDRFVHTSSMASSKEPGSFWMLPQRVLNPDAKAHSPSVSCDPIGSFSNVNSEVAVAVVAARAS
jgi:hypothetical protein